jgi:predicted nucleic acid-binding protein
MKVFLDTNVWLSATIFSGLCEELVIQCAERGCLLSSALVQAEAHEVLARKFPQKPTAGALFDASWQVALLLSDVADPADDNDQRLVAAAEMGGVTLFVTGDKRVLGWKARAAMRTVSPREAWVMLQDGAERSVL